MAPHVDHSDIVRFGNEVVNLHQDRVRRYRKQVNDLRDRLATKIRDNPDFALVKMLHSGSVAKGTALSSINDMDVAVYVRKSDPPGDDSELLDWLVDRLREANPNMHSEQFNPGTHCVSVNFRGTGLDVDVVPVLYEDDPDDRGYLLNRDKRDVARNQCAPSLGVHQEAKSSGATTLFPGDQATQMVGSAQ